MSSKKLKSELNLTTREKMLVRTAIDKTADTRAKEFYRLAIRQVFFKTLAIGVGIGIAIGILITVLYYG